MQKTNALQRIVKYLLRKLYYWIMEEYVVKPKYRPIPVNMAVIPSPNYFKTCPNREVKYIVLHATASSTTESAVRWFKDPASKVSAHYVIGKDGSVVQMVDLEHIAWHAGKSECEGFTDINNKSVGIELVNLNDGKDPYTPSQINSALAISEALTRYYSIPVDNVVTHAQIAPSRKTDPLGFPVGEFKTSLAFYRAKGDSWT